MEARFSLKRFNQDQKQTEERRFSFTYDYEVDILPKLMDFLKDMVNNMDGYEAIYIIGKKDNQKQYINLEARP